MSGDRGVREDGGDSNWFRGRGFVWASEGSSNTLLPIVMYGSAGVYVSLKVV